MLSQGGVSEEGNEGVEGASVAEGERANQRTKWPNLMHFSCEQCSVLKTTKFNDCECDLSVI